MTVGLPDELTNPYGHNNIRNVGRHAALWPAQRTAT